MLVYSPNNKWAQIENKNDVDSTQKYVNNYFLRRVRTEVLNHMDAKTPEVVRAAQRIMRNLSKNDQKSAKLSSAGQKKANFDPKSTKIVQN